MELTEVIRHEVPIAIRALKTANIYEIFSDRHILVDTGMSPASRDFLEERGVDLSSLDLVVMTHLHVDHIGGAESIRSKYGTPLAIGKEDSARVQFIRDHPEGFREFLQTQLTINGTPVDLVNQIVGRHSVLDNVGLYRDISFDRELKGGEYLAENVRVIENPGHSPGSISILLEDTGHLLTGDHLLPGITPNISFYDQSSDMLGLYISSLHKTRELNAKYILPGHRDPFDYGNRRIDEILAHHAERLNEIITASHDWSSAYDVATRIKWSKGRSLSSMNLMEMNFGIGEAISHITHLYTTGYVEKKVAGGVSLFKSNGHSVSSL